MNKKKSEIVKYILWAILMFIVFIFISNLLHIEGDTENKKIIKATSYAESDIRIVLATLGINFDKYNIDINDYLDKNIINTLKKALRDARLIENINERNKAVDKVMEDVLEYYQEISNDIHEDIHNGIIEKKDEHSGVGKDGA